jgi:ribosomal protein S18 acetylase RimI-like enzyme
MDVRPAESAELDALARIWHQGWHEAHAAIVAPELTALRTLENFRDRLEKDLEDVSVAGSVGTPLGFCMIKKDELYQLYVSAESRQAGVASALIADGEARLFAHGIRLAWLACAIGNERAARFYEKRGWRRAGVIPNVVETSRGEYVLDVWRYEKDLNRGPR